MEQKPTYLVALGAILFIGIIIAIGGFILVTSNEDDDEDNQEISQENDNPDPIADELNIVETAQSTSSLSTLVEAVIAANLVEVLSDESASYTVFAPTNSAFANIQSTLDTLLIPENQADLQNVLQYHVVNTAVFSNNLTDGQIVTTLQGDTLKVRIINGEVYINNSRVVTADVSTSNGVVHIIDEVLVPGTFTDVVGTAQNTADLSTLVDAVIAADLATVLADPNANYTVFAPTNNAFGAIQDTVNTLLQPENQADLQNVLQYHVVSTEAFSTELSDGQIIETLTGETLEVEITSEGVFIVANNSRAQVITPDVRTSNGVVHIIDTVLLP